MTDYADLGLDAVTSGFEVQAKAHLDTMDLQNKTFDITADVPWRAVFVVSGVVSGVVATVMVLGQVVSKMVSKL